MFGAFGRLASGAARLFGRGGASAAAAEASSVAGTVARTAPTVATRAAPTVAAAGFGAKAASFAGKATLAVGGTLTVGAVALWSAVTSIAGAAWTMATTAATAIAPYAPAIIGVLGVGFVAKKIFGSKEPEVSASAGPVAPARNYNVEYNNPTRSPGGQGWANYVQNRGPTGPGIDR